VQRSQNKKENAKSESQMAFKARKTFYRKKKALLSRHLFYFSGTKILF
jgi:hypothetical protein